LGYLESLKKEKHRLDYSLFEEWEGGVRDQKSKCPADHKCGRRALNIDGMAERFNKQRLVREIKC